MKLRLIALAAALASALPAQTTAFENIPSSSYPALDAILNKKLKHDTANGAPTGNCTTGKQIYTDSATGDEYWCAAPNTWRKKILPDSTGRLNVTTCPGGAASGSVCAAKIYSGGTELTSCPTGCTCDGSGGMTCGTGPTRISFVNGTCPSTAATGYDMTLCSESGVLCGVTAGGTKTCGLGGASPLTTAGDLLVRNATVDTRLPIGSTNGHVLTVDTSLPEKVKWAAQAGGGGGGPVRYMINLPTGQGNQGGAGENPAWWLSTTGSGAIVVTPTLAGVILEFPLGSTRTATQRFTIPVGFDNGVTMEAVMSIWHGGGETGEVAYKIRTACLDGTAAYAPNWSTGTTGQTNQTGITVKELRFNLDFPSNLSACAAGKPMMVELSRVAPTGTEVIGNAGVVQVGIEVTVNP
jgi:hypothetical protein